MCRPSDVRICAEADRDIRDGSVVIHVSAEAPTMKTAIAGNVRIQDRVLEQRAAQAPGDVAQEIMRDVFDALQKQVDQRVESLLTDDAKRARDEQPDEPIPGMFAAMESMAAWEGRNHGSRERRTDLVTEARDTREERIARQRARALEAVAKGGQARTTVRDADVAIRAAREGLFSSQEALDKIRRARNQGVKMPAEQLLGLHAGLGSDQIDALTFALGAVAPAAKRTSDAMRRTAEAARRVAESVAAFKVETDPSVPPGEVHATFGGKTLGKVTGIKGVKADHVFVDDVLPGGETLSMRCASCGGRAILDDGVFGMAGASYSCGSCGTVFDDCKQCRAIHARRSDNTCPRCSGRERRKAKE
jgi:DNA-directed RNA polymerase subunit RPC12/RpoP